MSTLGHFCTNLANLAYYITGGDAVDVKPIKSSFFTKEDSKPMVIRVSFRQQEKYLYDEIMRHSNYSAFVKDILKLYIKPPDEQMT